MLRTGILLILLAGAGLAEERFLARPYLQLGASADDPGRMAVAWQTAERGEYTVEVRTGGAWKAAGTPSVIAAPATSLPAYFIYSAELSGLAPGKRFEYRLRRGGETVFASEGLARKAKNQAFRFVTFGDAGQNNPPQREIAKQTDLAAPDWMLLLGDIVYSRGLASEYRTKFFPIYNAEPGTAGAVSLLEHRLAVGVPGNHDTATFDLEKYPDAQSYYLYWKQPLNGPELPAKNFPQLTGPGVAAYKAAAGAAFPRMANFSFDYGNAHFLVLDGNGWVNWQDAGLRAWVDADLAKAKGATWKFVAVHQPGFNSSKAHYSDQQVRWLADLFDRHAVDLVLSGHVHNYQRTMPLTFQAAGAGAKKGEVSGQWSLDRSYDGKKKRKPKGVIYIVSGAGGAGLYNPEQEDDHASWQEFTTRFVAKKHSLSVVDIKGRELIYRQVDGQGQEIDRFEIKK